MANPDFENLDDDLEQRDLESLIGYNLKRAYVVVQSDFRRTLGDDGLGPRTFAVLSIAIQFPNISQSEVARKLSIERSGLVALVDELEARGFLARVPVPKDRRVHALVPTENGKKAYNDAIVKIRNHEDELLANLSTDERATLIDLLRKVRAQEKGRGS